MYKPCPRAVAPMYLCGSIKLLRCFLQFHVYIQQIQVLNAQQHFFCESSAVDAGRCIRAQGYTPSVECQPFSRCNLHLQSVRIFFYLLLNCWWKIWLLPLVLAWYLLQPKRSADLLGDKWFTEGKVIPRLAQLRSICKSFAEPVKLSVGWKH